MTSKGDTNRKWASSESYREGWERIFGTKPWEGVPEVPKKERVYHSIAKGYGLTAIERSRHELTMWKDKKIKKLLISDCELEQFYAGPEALCDLKYVEFAQECSK